MKRSRLWETARGKLSQAGRTDIQRPWGRDELDAYNRIVDKKYPISGA